jgi:hypothetical protein
MSILKKSLHVAALSLAVASAPALTPIADAAGFDGSGFHGSGGCFGGFHGGFAGSGHHGGSGFRASGFDGPDRRFRDDAVGHIARSRDGQRDWHRYGHWENGAWIGIWPDYASDPYDAYWSYYCDPASPYFDPDDCSGY